MHRLVGFGAVTLTVMFVVSCADMDIITNQPEANSHQASACMNTSGAFGSGAPCAPLSFEGGTSPWGAGGFGLLAAVPAPDVAYLGSTTLIDISTLSNLALLPSVTDGSLTVAFAPRMMKVSSGVWASWSSPPFAETSAPHVLFSDFSNIVTLDLSQPVTTFGFEIAPNPWAPHTFTVDFIDSSGPTIVETIVKDAHGFQGSRLVASDLDLPVNRIRISGTADFAIAQLRYALGESTVAVDIEVPGTINQRSRGLIPVAILGSSAFDVMQVDGATIAFGPGAAAPAHSLGNPRIFSGHLEDTNGDGITDLLAHFRQVEVGLTSDDTEGCISGATLDGNSFEGCAPVRVINPGRLN